MKIPLQAGFTNVDGSPITLDNTAEGKPLTMFGVLVTAVATEFKEDQTPANIVQEKLRRFTIYQKLTAVGEMAESIDLTTEDSSYLKDRVARCFGMIVCGPAIRMLDGQKDSQKVEDGGS